MKLEPLFTKKDIERFVLKKLGIIEEVLLDRIIAVAEQFVADARSVDTYTDRTGNLRGSIGYMITKDGREVFGNFEGAEEGQSEAKRFAKRVSSQYKTGIILTVVAGMEYAASVEAKGYDVITASGQTADTAMIRSMNRLKQKLAQLK